MKSAKIFILFLSFILIGAGCGAVAPQKESTARTPQPVVQNADDTHVGCQEGEIEKDGSCKPAEENLAKSLYKDVDALVVTNDVVFPTHSGFVVEPKIVGKYPGVLMIHEWWGLNDNIKQMAKQLASEGYVVYAIDLYGQVATDSDKARELSGAVRANPQEALKKMKSAIKYLRDTKKATKVASLGWCFGGGQSLQISLNETLDATVIYYGTLVTDPAVLKSISGPVLGVFGAKDQGITVESVQSFEKALGDLSVEKQIYIYDNVGHAFANPSGSAYGEKEAIDAWDKTVKFLAESIK